MKMHRTLSALRFILSAALMGSFAMIAAPARAVVTGSSSTQQTQLFPVSAGAWYGWPTPLPLSTFYTRPVTYNKIVVTSTTTTSYADAWDRFFNVGGTFISTVGTTAPTVTITRTESETSSTPPVVSLDTRPIVWNSSDPPPVDDVAFYLGQVGETIRLPAPSPGTTLPQAFALAGDNYSQAASIFGAIVSDFSAVDDPHGLKSGLLTDFNNIDSDLSAIASSLQSGIPSSGSPYSLMAGDLSSLSTHINQVPGADPYVRALPDLGDAVNLLNDAAARVTSGITTSNQLNDDGTRFLQDLQGTAEDLHQFAIDQAPEPGAAGLFLITLSTLLRRSQVRR